MRLDSLLLDRWWLGAALMTVVAISDYVLTLWGARLYRGARNHVAFEGSYETVPIFEADIDAGRIVSFHFIVVLIVMVGLIASAARFGQSLGIENRWYLFLAGFFILIEVPIHVRHASNIVRFSLLGNSEAAAGRVTYVRWFVLRVSSVDFFSFAVLFLLGYAATGSWFILGGSIRCVAFGLFQLLLSWKARRKPVAVLE